MLYLKELIIWIVLNMYPLDKIKWVMEYGDPTSEILFE